MDNINGIEMYTITIYTMSTVSDDVHRQNKHVLEFLLAMVFLFDVVLRNASWRQALSDARANEPRQL
jgi:hypothetical protein